MPRIFLLSPANCGGLRARMVMSPRAAFPLARRLLEPAGAPLGEVFTFLSGVPVRAAPRAPDPGRPPLALPVRPPLPPMEAKLADALPPPGPWQFEPKWDGFRCLAFWDGARAALQSKAGQPLARYFPELVAALAALGAPRAVFDGEIVVPVEGGLSFDDLLLRIHPSETRIRKLAAERPAVLLVFDLLVDAEGRALLDRPLDARREALEAFAVRYRAGAGDVRLSPATTDRAAAQDWFARGDRWGLDGVMAKRRDAEYRPGDRSEMLKVKWMRTADCVVGGFRYGEGSDVVGSLLLGLYDDAELLHHVGFTSTLPAAERRALTPGSSRSWSRRGSRAARRAVRAAGAASGRASGSRSRPLSSARSATITSPGAASVTERRFSAGAPTRRRTSAGSPRWSPGAAGHRGRCRSSAGARAAPPDPSRSGGLVRVGPEIVVALLRAQPGRNFPAMEKVAHQAIGRRPVIAEHAVVVGTQRRLARELQSARSTQAHVPAHVANPVPTTTPHPGKPR